MKKIVLFVLLLAFAFCKNKEMATTETAPAVDSTTMVVDSNNMLTETEAAAGWKLLFDGKSLDSWRVYNGDSIPHTWKVMDGQIVLKPEGPHGAMVGGDLVTRDTFGDFELKFDFKLADSANSGLFYLVNENPKLSIWQTAPEFQLVDNNYVNMHEKDAATNHLTADNYDLMSCQGATFNAAGQWNTAGVVKKGNHVEHWLNGVKCVEYEIGSKEYTALVAKSKFKPFKGWSLNKTGRIGLQNHGGEIAFRNIKIR